MPKRDFLALSDLTTPELEGVLALALAMKRGEDRSRPLAGKAVAMIFGQSSTRTRVSFQVGISQLGGNALYLSARELQLGRGEPVRDTARTLSRYVDGIIIRTHAHGEVEELARFATVPVINGLTDLLHPCQVLADLLTVQEALGGWRGRVVAWIGDGNNMANSWLEAAALLGFELRLACPEGYEPNHDLFEAAARRTRVTITELPEEAVSGAHVVTTDVWTSMGHEGESRFPGPGLPGLRCGRKAHEPGRPARHLPALPPRASGPGGDRWRSGGPAVAGLGGSREPAARAEGPAGDPDRAERMTHLSAPYSPFPRST